MADRLSATQLADLNEPINALLRSELLQLIFKSSSEQNNQDIINNHRVSI